MTVTIPMAAGPAAAYTGQELAGDAKITVDQARAIALKAHPGRITDEELEREDGGSGLRYTFSVDTGLGAQELGVDAATGQVLENSLEWKDFEPSLTASQARATIATRMEQACTKAQKTALSKVPEVTLEFWIEQEHEPADPALAIKAAKSAGYRVVGGTRRKPKRFEVLKKKGTKFEEFHIELDGGVRNTSLLGDAVVA